jgi:transcriptional regulator with XRE-family HTH domain
MRTGFEAGPVSARPKCRVTRRISPAVCCKRDLGGKLSNGSMTNETDPTEAAQLLELLKAEQVEVLRTGQSLAELIGLSQPQLDKILSGEKGPNAQSLKKIAEYFARTRKVAPNPKSTPGSAGRSPLSRTGGATLPVVELDAVAQRKYIAAMLEASGIPKGVASHVGLHVELAEDRSPAYNMRAALALAQSMMAEGTDDAKESSAGEDE